MDIAKLERGVTNAEKKVAELTDKRDSTTNADEFFRASQELTEAQAHLDFHRQTLTNARSALERSEREAKLVRIRSLAESLASREPRQRVRPAAEKVVAAMKAGLEAIAELDREVGALLTLHREGLSLATELKLRAIDHANPGGQPQCPPMFSNPSADTPMRYENIARAVVAALIVKHGLKPISSSHMIAAIDHWLTFALIDESAPGHRVLYDLGTTYAADKPLEKQIEAALT